MKRVFLFLIDGYRKFISPYRPPSCRFAPTCSDYARQAVGRHGAWRGAILSVGRLLRCHPFHAGGYDPVISSRRPNS